MYAVVPFRSPEPGPAASAPPSSTPSPWRGRARPTPVAAAENHFNERIRLKAENERLRGEILLLREEMRIKDARMEQIPPHRRPHYPPVERLAILELRAARGWSQAQTAARFLVSALTISHWNQRLDEEGADALVQVPVPVNTYPGLRGLRRATPEGPLPLMGKARIANVLCRAGLASRIDDRPPHAQGDRQTEAPDARAFDGLRVES